MALLDSVTGFLGLTPDMSGVAEAMRFQPQSARTSFGSTYYDPETTTFGTNFDPRLQQARNRAIGRFIRATPDQQLSLFRQASEPQNQAMMQNLENRLFSQGRLDASQEYAPGGAMRGLFDSFNNQDLQFQLMANQEADRRAMNAMNQISGINNMELSLFNPALQFSGIANQAQQAQGQALMQGEMATSNFFGSLLGGGLMGFGAGGGFNGLFGGGGASPVMPTGGMPYGGIF